jgi:hypothetical protein
MLELGHLIFTAVRICFEVQQNPGESLIHEALSLCLIEAATFALLGTIPQGRRCFRRTKQGLIGTSLSTRRFNMDHAHVYNQLDRNQS